LTLDTTTSSSIAQRVGQPAAPRNPSFSCYLAHPTLVYYLQFTPYNLPANSLGGSWTTHTSLPISYLDYSILGVRTVEPRCLIALNSAYPIHPMESLTIMVSHKLSSARNPRFDTLTGCTWYRFRAAPCPTYYFYSSSQLDSLSCSRCLCISTVTAGRAITVYDIWAFIRRFRRHSI